MTKNPIFSIVIPVRQENDYLRETLRHLKNQNYHNFETIVITDKISHNPDPSFKRNLGVKKSYGQYICFLDDDSYPDINWLKNILIQIKKHPQYDAFCGPCLTPPKDNLYQQVSGLFWSSFLGSGGAGLYRNQIRNARLVDDYPTVNFIVKKTVFQKIGGFNSKYWPGEDTILCLDLINNNSKIYYHPSIKVFHHRRSILIPHLQQITRYALHRGLFARKYPKNSLKIGYLMPSFFLIYLLTLTFNHFFWPLYIYLFLLLLSFFYYIFSGFSLLISVLTILTIPITHLYYGFLFIIGFFKKDLNFKAHQVNQQSGHYFGG